ncbi:MAG: DUF177 domain-containing protein [Clostridia bacterium]|nr:DUF177 domain-containing protein [Clostridia bacterium]
MIFDISPLLRGDVKKLDVRLEVTPDRVPDGIRPLPGGYLDGTVTDTGGYIRLESRVTVPYEAECARCLDRVEGVLEFDFNRTLVSPGQVSERDMEENPDEYLTVTDGTVRFDEAVSESVFLEFPMLILCSPDCPGLCPHCGKKLAAGEKCGCSAPDVDPRWDALRKIVWDEEENAN